MGKIRPVYLNIRYALIQSLYWAANCAMLGFPMIYFIAKGFSFTQVGIITAMINLLSAVVQPSFSKILLRFRRLSVKSFLIILNTAAIVVGVLLLFLPANFPVYLLAFAAISVTQTAASSLLSSLAMEYLNSGIDINFGITRGIGSAAYAIIAIIIGKLLTFMDVWILNALDILTLLLLNLVLIFLKPPKYYLSTLPKVEHPELSFEDSHPSNSVNVFLKRNPVIVPFLLATGIVFISATLMGTALAPNYVERFNGTSSDAGTIIFTSAMSELPMMVLFGALSKRFRVSRLLVISGIGFIIKAIGSVMASSVLFYTLVQLTQGFGYGLFTVASVLFTNSIISLSDRVLAQGLLFSMSAIGCTIGNLFSGYLLDVTGISGVLVTCITTAFLGGGLIIYSALVAEKRLADKLKLS